MESDNVAENVERNESYSKKEKRVVDEMKTILTKQIAELESVISEMESRLGILKLDQIKLDMPVDETKLTEAEMQDLNLLSECQIHVFSGFYCVKFTKDEIVFYFSCSNKPSEENTYAVQIRNKDSKWSVGRWAMPDGIDMAHILSQVPIGNEKNIPRFLKRCKIHLDAYHMRKEQYDALMEVVSCTKNCKVQSSLGYKQIILELINVYNQETDKYMNIIAYLFYDFDSLLPLKIQIDSSLKTESDEATKRHLKKCLRCFKEFELQIAFDKLSITKPFVWAKEDKNMDSPFNDVFNDEEEEEDGFLKQYLKKSKESSVRRNRSKEVRREESQNESSNVPNENDPTSSQSNQQESRNEKVHSKNTGPAIHTTVYDSQRVKLKQTKIDFHTKSKLPEDDSGNNNNESNTSLLKPLVSINKKMDKRNKLIASTPVHSCALHPAGSANIDISDITVNENLDTTNRSEVKDRGKSNAPQEQSQTKKKAAPRKKRKSPVKSKPQASKTKKRKV